MFLVPSVFKLITEYPELTIPLINHTNHSSIRRKPIAISIETQTISRTEEEARISLATWVASQIERLKRLLYTFECRPDHLAAIAFSLTYV